MRARDLRPQKLAQIADVCRWHAVGGPLTGRRQAAALAELARITGGRTELLTRYAVEPLAWHDTGPGESRTSAPLSCTSLPVLT